MNSSITRKKEKVLIRAGAGCLLPKLVNYCISQNLSGLEFGVGIPGSIGGAVVMNAGAWGHEIGNLVESVTLMDNQGKIFSEQGKNLGFTYRGWGVKPDTILLYADLTLINGSSEGIKAA